MPQIVSPSVPSGPATITERYDALVASGTIERDPAQETVVVSRPSRGHKRGFATVSRRVRRSCRIRASRIRSQGLPFNAPVEVQALFELQ